MGAATGEREKKEISPVQAVYDSFIPYAEALLNHGFTSVLPLQETQILFQKIASLPHGSQDELKFYGQKAEIYEISQNDHIVGVGWQQHRMIIVQFNTYDKKRVQVNIVEYPDRLEASIGMGRKEDYLQYEHFTAKKGTESLVFTHQPR